MIRVWAVPAIAAAAVALTGCGGGTPTESDYIQACVAAHEADEGLCKCTATEAKAKLSPEGWKVFVLQAQGKTQEASEIAMKMPVEDRGKMVAATIEVATACVAALQK